MTIASVKVGLWSDLHLDNKVIIPRLSYKPDVMVIAGDVFSRNRIWDPKYQVGGKPIGAPSEFFWLPGPISAWKS